MAAASHNYLRTNNDQNDSPDSKTLELVQEFKRIASENYKSSKPMTEEDVESYTYKAKNNLYRDDYDLKQWRKEVLSSSDHDSGRLLLLSMAYVDSPKQIEPIFQRKKEQLETKSSKLSIEEPVNTSLESIIQPLKQLKSKIKSNQPQSLCSTILHMKDEEIDRADRMFYSEACRLRGSSNGYTFDQAHDQVQAIRMSHCEINDNRDLRHFIENYRNFDEAYSYLQSFTQRSKNRSSTATNASQYNKNNDDDNSKRKHQGSNISSRSIISSAPQYPDYNSSPSSPGYPYDGNADETKKRSNYNTGAYESTDNRFRDSNS